MINLTSPLLLAITFVFGVIFLITMTKLFDKDITTITSAFIPFDVKRPFGKFLRMIGVWFFYLSLIHQAWYWLFFN